MQVVQPVVPYAYMDGSGNPCLDCCLNFVIGLIAMESLYIMRKSKPLSRINRLIF